MADPIGRPESKTANATGRGWRATKRRSRLGTGESNATIQDIHHIRETFGILNDTMGLMYYPPAADEFQWILFLRCETEAFNMNRPISVPSDSCPWRRLAAWVAGLNEQLDKCGGGTTEGKVLAVAAMNSLYMQMDFLPSQSVPLAESPRLLDRAFGTKAALLKMSSVDRWAHI